MSGNFIKLIEMFQRAKDGPSCTIREWEINIIPKTVNKYLKKYELDHTFSPEQPVNQNPELADRFFQAGLDLAEEIGLLCTDTETVIKVSRAEILQSIEKAPDHLILGEREDQIRLQARTPEDSAAPIFGGPVGNLVSEELYLPVTVGTLKSKTLKIHEGLALDTVFGYPAYSGTPLETVMAFQENRLREEAEWRAGRTGIPDAGVASSTTEYGQLGGFVGLTKKNKPALSVILHPAELKISYASFHKAAVTIEYEGYINSGTPSMIGGYSGGAEGAALANIATTILQFPIMQADVADCGIYDIRFDSTCGRHGLWALSIACQGLTRNTHLLLQKVINQSAGPCTEEILYSSAAGLLAGGVSGLSCTFGCRSAAGRLKNYVSPLEHWFCGAAFEACAGISLDKANELALYMLNKYEKTMAHPPRGKSFVECFNPTTLTPSPEWGKIYTRVVEDLQSHGFPINPDEGV